MGCTGTFLQPDHHQAAIDEASVKNSREEIWQCILIRHRGDGVERMVRGVFQGSSIQ